ncbi:MAG: twin-arginine translocase TatA/TatE family subunit [Planctomycetota bacterium]|nr:twin-arginine translocase TatA/TatE family subunit [Planctomycetota bacterium]
MANATGQLAAGMLAVPTYIHWVIVLLAILLLFGGKKLPELARGLGRGLRIFKEELSGISDGVKEGLKEEPKPAAPKAPDASPAAPADKPADPQK